MLKNLVIDINPNQRILLNNIMLKNLVRDIDPNQRILLNNIMLKNLVIDIDPNQRMRRIKFNYRYCMILCCDVIWC